MVLMWSYWTLSEIPVIASRDHDRSINMKWIDLTCLDWCIELFSYDLWVDSESFFHIFDKIIVSIYDIVTGLVSVIGWPLLFFFQNLESWCGIYQFSCAITILELICNAICITSLYPRIRWMILPISDIISLLIFLFIGRFMSWSIQFLFMNLFFR